MTNKPARNEEPFLLLANRNPEIAVTNEQLSEQIGAVSAHLCVVHREASLARVEASDAKNAAGHARAAAEDASQAADEARDSVVELRKLVIGDHAPRLTQVEEKAAEVEETLETVATSRGISISPRVRRGAVKAGCMVGVASIWPIAEALLPVILKALQK